MVDESTDDALREMAQHRGYKLLKSRRRKPGTGDYGKFGLTDAAGKTVLGVTDDGLTASASDIEDYLRTGAVSTWQESARQTPDRPAQRPVEKSDDRAEPVSVVTEQGRELPARIKSRALREPPARPSRDARQPRVAPEPAPPKDEPPGPTLVVRAGRPADSKALQAWLGDSLKGEASRAEAVQLVLRKGGVAVALMDEIVGCCAWSTLPTLQHGLVGRVTLLLVGEGFRRQGIGGRLLAEAEKALAIAGCKLVEVMSDIDFRNYHGFFRTLGFEQKSYRFVRSLSDPRGSSD